MYRPGFNCALCIVHCALLRLVFLAEADLEAGPAVVADEGFAAILGASVLERKSAGKELTAYVARAAGRSGLAAFQIPGQIVGGHAIKLSQPDCGQVASAHQFVDQLVRDAESANIVYC